MRVQDPRRHGPLADQRHDPGEHRSHLRRPAVEERAHPVAALPGHGVDHRLPRAVGAPLEPHHLGEPEGEEDRERGRDREHAERREVEHGQDHHHRGHAEPGEEPVHHEERQEQGHRGGHADEQPEEPGEVVGLWVPRDRGSREGEVEGEEEEGEQDRSDRHPPQQRGAERLSEAVAHLGHGRRAASPRWTDARAGVPDELPTRRTTTRTSVASHTRIRFSVPSQAASGRVREPREDLPEHGRPADQREEALRLPRVRHEAGQSPDRHAQEELRGPAEEPQGRVDPADVRGQEHPGGHDDERDRRRDREEGPSPAEPSEQDGDPERREEHRAAQEEVQDGQIVDPATGEQERVDAARGEREAGGRRERGRGGGGHHPPLPGQQSQQPVHGSLS